MNYILYIVCSILIINSLVVLVYIMHSIALASLSYINKDRCLSKYLAMPNDLPVITIQLPIFNERYVVHRLLNSIILLNYPQEKLDIQILDDSTDDTYEMLVEQVSHLRRNGWSIEHLHRTNRNDFKGGALREGMHLARGDYIAIFDADFIPNKDFIVKTLPILLSNEHIGLVQTRWGHTNEADSYITEAQAVSIDTHFLIEQTARNANGLWMNFNGTAGIWRKKAIVDAGNWSGDTLTEDMDLSYRALIKGWHFRYLVDVVNPAELPPTIEALKSQQFRWAKGTTQTAIKLLPNIWRSDCLIKVKVFATLHLLSYIINISTIINLIFIPILMLIGSMNTPIDEKYNGLNIVINIIYAINIISPFFPAFYYMVAQHKRGQTIRKSLLLVPITLVLGLSLSVNNSLAFIEAIIGRKSDFVRTPKLNLVDSKISYYEKIGLKPVIIVECVAAIYAGCSSIIAYNTGFLLFIPIFLALFVGYSLILFEVLRASFARRTS